MNYLTSHDFNSKLLVYQRLHDVICILHLCIHKYVYIYIHIYIYIEWNIMNYESSTPPFSMLAEGNKSIFTGFPKKNDLKPVLYVLSHCWLMVAVYHEIWIIMVVFVHPFLINSPNVRQIHNNLLNQCLLSNSSTWQWKNTCWNIKLSHLSHSNSTLGMSNSILNSHGRNHVFTQVWANN
jgi:hypothetical protein